MKASFGFSVACFKGDIPLLRGCLESLRYFAPDVPVCLIAHGEFSTRTLERVYGVQVIRRQDVRDAGLRRSSFGYGLTKMIAAWESPFETVFMLDADAVLWGDIRKNLPAEPWDFVYNEPHETITPFIQNTQYFKPDEAFKYIKPFDWEGNPYFNTGSLCLRRGCLDLDEYLQLVELQHKHSSVFCNGDQGILNILVFRAIQAGRLKARQAHLQSVLPAFTREELETRFRVERDKPVVEDRPTILHWAGPKPWSGSKDIFSTPMDFFRQKAMQRCGLPTAISTKTAMAADEYLSRQVPKYLLDSNKAMRRVLGKSK